MPIVLSHSGPKAIFEPCAATSTTRGCGGSPRAGGVMFMNSHLPRPARQFARARRDRRRGSERWAELNAAERRQLLADTAALERAAALHDRRFRPLHARLLHAISVMGVDHVGLGADWDGGGGVIGMEDVAAAAADHRAAAARRL